MIHPHSELRFISDKIGFGVVATKLIPKGTITWVRDPLDQSFTSAEVSRLPALYRREIDKYCFVDGNDAHILCWDIARYVNHHCDAPCLAAGYNFELAVRDIHPGEELRDDYGTLNLIEPFECACDSPSCRGMIRPDDHERLAGRWDRSVREAFPAIASVEQPLWSLVREKDDVQSALRDPAKIATCRVHFPREARGLTASAAPPA